MSKKKKMMPSLVKHTKASNEVGMDLGARDPTYLLHANQTSDMIREPEIL